MKKALLGCLVVGISGTEFDDGSKAAKITLEDFTSFNVPENSKLLSKINVGTTFDLTYSNDREKESTTQSGASVTYHNLQGVKVIASSIKQGEEDKELAALPDVTDPTKINYRKVSGGTGAPGGDTSAPPRV